MPLIVSNPESQPRKSHELPSAGLHPARLGKVIDKGMVESKFGLQHRVLFVWLLLDENDSHNQPKVAFSGFNLSLSPKSLLSKLVRSLLGELPASLDLESLVGIEVNLLLEHNETPTGTFCNVAGVVRREVRQ